MKLPWHDRTGIPKAIAILATTAILAFGLCAANLVLGLPGSDNKWFKPLEYLPGFCSVIVIASLLALAILVDLNNRRSRRKP